MFKANIVVLFAATLAVHSPTWALASLKIYLSNPERATLLRSDDPYNVTGQVKGGFGDKYLIINNQSVSMDKSGNFFYTLFPQHGANLIAATAKDSLGSTAFSTRTVYQSNAWLDFDAPANATATLRRSIDTIIDKSIIEEAIESLKSYFGLSYVVQQGLSSINMTELQKKPVFEKRDYFANGSSQYEARGFLRSLNFLNPSAYASLREGGVHVSGNFAQRGGLSGLAAVVDVDVSLLLFNKVPLPVATFTLTFLIDQLNVGLNINAAKVDGQSLAMNLHNFTLSQSGSGVDVSVPDDNVNTFFQPWRWLFPSMMQEWFVWLADELINKYRGAILDSTNSELTKELSSKLGEIISKVNVTLALDQSISTHSVSWATHKPSLDIHIDMATLDVHENNIAASFATKLSTNQNLNHPKKDVILRGNCNNQIQAISGSEKPHPLKGRASVDLVNQIFHILWWGGLFDVVYQEKELTLPGESPLPIKDLFISVHPLLPPIVDDCNADGNLIAQVGDAKMDMTFNAFGQKFVVTAYGSATATVQLGSDGDTIQVVLLNTNITSFDVTELQAGLFSDPALVEMLFNDYVFPYVEKQYPRIELFNFDIPKVRPHDIFDWIPEEDDIAFHNITVAHEPGFLRADAYVQ